MSDLRRVAGAVATLNLAYFAVEFAVALSIGSVALFADSVDFLEDACVNCVILVALSWTVRNRARLGKLFALILLGPSLATVWMAWRKLHLPVPPDPIELTATGAGALVVNSVCAVLLARHRRQAGSLTRAAFLSARNDVIANLAIIVAGCATAWVWPSAWPDLIVGLGVALMNADAAHEVWGAAVVEHRSAI